ncbi:MAG: uracil-DNA glycosylase [Dehalococcoidia bacterium]|nr:uracil-DNA glycosylase [Dehalococcoidia bacterium]
MTGESLETTAADVIACRRCPRLVWWREKVAREKKAAYRDWEYWGRPVPGFGDAGARLLVVGLAPAAHGGNRTGRIFTGDRSGDWLYRALHRAGFANQAASAGRDDGLRLTEAYVTAVVRCAPPGNRPAPDERDSCLPYLERELRLLADVRVIVPLGAFALEGVARALGLRPRPAFAHRREIALADGRTIICSFHPSQQNTFTGRLTEAMLDAVFGRARELIEPL